MQTTWLSKKNRPSCILFFAGWGMDPAPFTGVVSSNHDLLMVYDYRDMQLTPAITDPVEEYQTLYLLAWSMGVWVAGHQLEPYKKHLAGSVAVNGTLKPVDDRCGIGKKPFAAMIKAFSKDSLKTFYSSMFDEPGETEIFMQNQPWRATDEILAELIALRDGYQEKGPAQDIFSRHLVGSRDQIFPARNQRRCWGKDNCTVLQMPHFPFYGQHGLDALIQGQ